MAPCRWLGIIIPALCLAIAVPGLCGCGTPPPTADPAPFEAAVARYLADNKMELRLKEIREGPAIDGDSASMSASLTHRELGGLGVVWEFQFRRLQADAWQVTSHAKK